jgi:hypothetical protein
MSILDVSVCLKVSPSVSQIAFTTLAPIMCSMTEVPDKIHRYYLEINFRCKKQSRRRPCLLLVQGSVFVWSPDPIFGWSRGPCLSYHLIPPLAGLGVRVSLLFIGDTRLITVLDVVRMVLTKTRSQSSLFQVCFYFTFDFISDYRRPFFH